MTYHYGRYWAEIRPIRSQPGNKIVQWSYRIFESGSSRFLFDGGDASYESALMTAERHIDRLNEEDNNISRVA